MKKLLLGIFAVAAMASCAKEQTIATVKQEAIAFSNFVQHTKVVDPSFNNDTNPLQAFYVWGFVNAPSGVIFDQELVEYDATTAAWTYQNLAYWAPGKTYHFAALAPVNNNKIGVTLANGNLMSADGVLGTVTFENVDGTVDVLYAEDDVTTPTTIPDNPEEVELTFNHLLSKIKFTFTNGLVNENSSMVVSNVKMVVPANGTVDLAVKPFVWTLTGTETTELVFGKAVDANGSENLAPAGVGVIENERLTIPTAATESLTITFDVTIYNGDQVAQTIPMTSVLTGKTLEAGKSYNLTANLTADKLGLKKIDFTVLVNDWVPETNDIEI